MSVTVQQLFQSLLQFLTILIAELTHLATVNGGQPPTSWGEIYVPVLLALAGALVILGGSRVRVSRRKLTVQAPKTDKGPPPGP